jgi:hypothetical protein
MLSLARALLCAQVYISSGRGVKSVVSDDELAVVLDNIKPALKHERCAAAFVHLSAAASMCASCVCADQPQSWSAKPAIQHERCVEAPFSHC